MVHHATIRHNSSPTGDFSPDMVVRCGNDGVYENGPDLGLTDRLVNADSLLLQEPDEEDDEEDDDRKKEDADDDDEGDDGYSE
jgi:hypothetical protein